MKGKKKEAYLVCERCNKNNWDTPSFWGCPRGCGIDCEATVKGTITTKLKLKKV